MLITILITIIAALVFLLPLVFSIGLKIGSRATKSLPAINKDKQPVEAVRFDDRTTSQRPPMSHGELVQIAVGVENSNALKNVDGIKTAPHG